jgi:tryptophan halogenase
MIPNVKKVLVLGGGSAGFFAAISIKTIVPDIDVEVIRSPEIGIIGVGEATTPVIPTLLHGFLNLDLADFYRDAEPAWKLGIRFIWGPRRWFNYTFSFQCDTRYARLEHPTGYYCFDDFDDASISSSLMNAERAFLRRPDGFPNIERDAAYHLENVTFVSFLEKHAMKLGIKIRDDNVIEVKKGDAGVESLKMASGIDLGADLFVDCSGFRSLLLGQALEEPFISFKKSLYCDRAIIGGWDREDENILPFTIAETMPSGWCWRIDHEHRINRGYVFSSDFLSEEKAIDQYLEKCPKIKSTKVVRFKSGRYDRMWVKNVVAIGNSSGFVEPLESTSLGAIAVECQAMAQILKDSPIHQVTDSQIRQFNIRATRNWDTIRDFLAIHYRFNTRLQTPFWTACVNDTDIADAAPIVEFYQENGPGITWRDTLIDRHDQFKLEGYWTMLIGQKVPYKTTIKISDQDKQTWYKIREAHRRMAASALSAKDSFAAIRHPQWSWNNDFYRETPRMGLCGMPTY